MLFGVVSGVGQKTGVLDGVHIPQGEGKVLGAFLPVGLNGVFECIFKTEMYLTHA